MKKINVLIFGWILSIPLTQPVLAEDCILTYKSNSNGYIVTGATNKSTCTKADIPSTYNNKPVTTIASQAFYYSPLEEVNIADSVTSIGSYAFMATKLTTVIIPTSVKSVGGYAFHAINAGSQGTLVYFPEGANYQQSGNVPCVRYNKVGDYYSVDGKVYSSLKEVEKLCPQGHQCWKCGATRIGCYGDFDPETGKLTVTGNGQMTSKPWENIMSQIKSADISGVTNIVSQAFYSSPIEEVNISDSVTSIGSYAFWGTKLTTVIIPTSVKSVGGYAFHAMGKGSFVYFPENANYQPVGSVPCIRYSKVGDYYSMNGKMYRNLENMLKGIEMKRIYTVSEAEKALGNTGKNTFSIRYR